MSGSESSSPSPAPPSQNSHASSTFSSAAPAATEAPNADAAATAKAIDDPLVQYVVVRRDLLDTWPTGSVIAQAVHASVAAVWQSRSASHTLAYCNQPGNTDVEEKGVTADVAALPQMHTVVLQAKSDTQLLNLADKLTANSIGFVLWKEQPEDFVTALAAYPYPQSAVKKHFSKFRLFK